MTTATTWPMGQRTAECRYCGVALHRRADAATDEAVWAGPDGHQFGPDPDLPPDPYAHLADLAGRPHDLAAMGEYSLLKVRLALGGTIHTHSPRDGGPTELGTMPWHCDWPGWLRPSGWCCRICGRRLLPLVALSDTSQSPGTTTAPDLEVSANG